MTPERYKEVGQLYRAALEVEPERRAAFLAEACNDDEALRQEVESLLDYATRSGGLMDQPALEVAAKALAEDQPWSPVGQSLGHYRILSLLGKGGMGEVYCARDTKLDRTVALKILPAELAADQDRLRRFVREAKAASALNHPHVATIYEIGESDNAHFIAMEHVEGQTLAARIKGQPLAVNELVEIGGQIADALDEAHSKGITHRDIKPANVMLTARGQVKVLDFGLAKITPPAQPADSEISALTKTEPGVMMGTVAYMSPEQALGREVDARSDLFSLGVVLYEMATGQRPFRGATVTETIDHILHTEPEAITQINEQAPAALAQIVSKCLAKDRERRYQSARELLDDLCQLKSGSFSAQRALPTDPNAPTLRTLAGKTAAMSVVKGRARWLLAGALVVAVLTSALAYWRMYRAQPAISGPPEIKSLAVLPLENLSGDPAQEYFADGMTESLISSLGQIHALNRVISRTSMMRYKGSRKSLPEIAAELKVDAVIEGTVQRVGGRVRVTAKLIPAATDSPVWAQEYERDLSDVLKLQNEIARTVAEEIRIQLTAEERARLAAARSVDPVAHEQYALGRYHYWKRNEEGYKRAIEHFERAIQLASNYAAAYSGLSDAWLYRGIYGAKPFREVEAPARAAALMALALDNNLAEAHASLGRLKFTYDFDWAGAEEEIKRALTLGPNNLIAHNDYAFLLHALGRFPEAILQIQTAAQLDPVSPAIQADFGRILYRARKYVEAVEHLNRALELAPDNGVAYGRLGDVYTEMGRYEEAIAAFERAQAFSNNPMYKARRARAYVLAGRRREALRLLEELKAVPRTGRFPGYSLATVYAALGDKDEAFRLLVKAVEERDQLSCFLKTDPPFDSLHSDPRWKELLRRMNFPTE